MDRALSQAALRAAVLAGSGLYTRLDVVARTGSTNADLLAAARAGVPAGSVLVAEEQTAGRGRLDRHWQSAAGTGLTFSLLLRPAGVPPSQRGWLPLLTGVAVAGALRPLVPSVGLKWPNDVLIGCGGTPRPASGADPGGRPPGPPDGADPGGRPPGPPGGAGLDAAEGRTGKVAGILAEQAGGAIVVGIGLNVASSADALPPGATSLLLAGVGQPDREAVLIAVLREFEHWYLRWAGGYAPGDAESSGLRAEYLRWCTTVGRQVRVELPGGGTLAGLASGVDETGRLLVTTTDGASPGEVRAVSAGDVVHVR